MTARTRLGTWATERWLRLRSTPPPVLVAWVFAVCTVVVPSYLFMASWWSDTSTFGFHDWDVQTSHRYLATRSLLSDGEWPGWNPYACGGFPAWGYVESATQIISPWLPFYAFADIRTALRIEVLGMSLLGALGTFKVAGRFTESVGARCLVVALFAVNGRWGLQTASGHTWHLAYAILPWALWAFERARTLPLSYPHLVGLGVAFAMLVYAGGIYPLPHTVLLLALWALVLGVGERTVRPLLVLGAGGLIGVGLSAPKLLPMLATFDRSPRLIESTETLGVGAFWTLLTSREQGFFDRPAKVSPYGWHEWGMYISLPGALLLLVAFILATGRKEAMLKVVGAAFVVLGFGAFHEQAPWTLLHEHVPVFRSQHVPSRFLYPAVLVLGLVLSMGAGAVIKKLSARRPWADPLLAALAFALACDVATIAKKPMDVAMRLHAPAEIAGGEFHFERDPPHQYKPRDWAGPMYLAMLADTGVLNCYGAPPFDERGAVARGDRRYKGEVYVDPTGTASLVTRTANRASVDVQAAPSGARLVYNMNFDRGWVASVRRGQNTESARVEPAQHRVSVVLPEGDSTVSLEYRPPGLRLGVFLFVVTSLLVVAEGVRRRRSGAW